MISVAGAFPILSAYDAGSRTAGSVDPLGALSTYGALAEKLLPGLTTVTRRARYLSMICAALYHAEKRWADAKDAPDPGPAGLERRRRAVEAFERLWALACVTTGADGAADQLLGVTYAKKALADFVADGEVHLDWRLLQAQHRAGGLPTYWVLLESSRLIDSNGCLLEPGKALGKLFPVDPLGRHLPPCERAETGKFSILLHSVKEWGRGCHLAGARKEEKALLSEALRTQGRESVARALKTMEGQGADLGAWDAPQLRRLAKTLAKEQSAVDLLLPETLRAIDLFEAFHGAASALFDWFRWKATRGEADALDSLAATTEARSRAEKAKGCAGELVAEYQQAKPSVAAALRRHMDFAKAVAAASSPLEIGRVILERHRQVQSGKTDGGSPKARWVEVRDEGLALGPHQRAALKEEPGSPEGRLTHPYRLAQFSRMLRDAGYLSRPA